MFQAGAINDGPRCEVNEKQQISHITKLGAPCKSYASECYEINMHCSTPNSKPKPLSLYKYTHRFNSLTSNKNSFN